MPLRRSVIIPARHSPIKTTETDTAYEIALRSIKSPDKIYGHYLYS